MKVILQNGIRGLSGTMEDWVYQYRNGKTYIGPRHPSSKEPTQAMINQRDRFREAAVYGKTVLADPALCAFYKPFAEERGITIYTMAVADFLNTPEFESVDLSGYQGQVGDLITIRAKDNLGMAEVHVTLRKNDGTTIEQGQAIEKGVRSGVWIYAATQPVAQGSDIFVEVAGVDHAGTEISITENPTVGMEE